MSADPSAAAAVAEGALRVVLIGQPNTGKTSLFNRLTGLRQRVGNYPGVTVERKEGIGRAGDVAFTLVDLPGTYSLNALSMDEHISVRALAGHPDIGPVPDVIVCVVDAAKLQRSLLPAFQAAALGRPMVLALNFFDEAEALGWRFDLPLLEERLGIPVVPTVGHRGEGIGALKEAVLRASRQRMALTAPEWPPAVQEAVRMLETRLDYIEDTDVRRFRAQRLLFDTAIRAEDDLAGSPTQRHEAVEAARSCVMRGGYAPATAEPVLLFPVIERMLAGALEKSGTASRRVTEGLDQVLLHPVAGLLVFALLMFGVFQAVYSWAGPLMEGIESLTAALQEAAGGVLEGMPVVQSLVVDGVIAGLGGVAVFLPQILILTLLVALLEDCGYLARAAFLVDKALGWCGLSGKSFVPLMSGYACAIPAIMATRTIEDPKARLTTILAAPLMSCSARLPVYVLMIGAFIEPRHGSTVAALVLLAMHLLGPVVALPLAWLFQKRILKAPAPPFVLELPPYRRPTLRDLSWRLWHRAHRFLTDAGTIILAMSVVIWALLYFPRPAQLEDTLRAAWSVPADMDPEEAEEAFQAHLDSAYLEQSYLGRAGRWMQPVFDPAGFDWKITVALLASFPAREVVISTLGIIYQLGGGEDEASEGLRRRLRQELWTEGPRAGHPVFTVPVAAAVMVFFAICMQCGATVAMITAEASWRWAWGAFAAMTALAWLGAVLTYQILGRVAG